MLQLNFSRTRACRVFILMGTGSGALVKRISFARFETCQCRHTFVIWLLCFWEDNKKFLRDNVIARKRMYRENLRNNKPGRSRLDNCCCSTCYYKQMTKLWVQSEHNIATISLQHLTYLFQHFCFYLFQINKISSASYRVRNSITLLVNFATNYRPKFWDEVIFKIFV